MRGEWCGCNTKRLLGYFSNSVADQLHPEKRKTRRTSKWDKEMSDHHWRSKKRKNNPIAFDVTPHSLSFIVTILLVILSWRPCVQKWYAIWKESGVWCWEKRIPFRSHHFPEGWGWLSCVQKGLSLSLFFSLLVSLLPTLFSLVSTLKSHCYVSFCDKRYISSPTTLIPGKGKKRSKWR